MDQGQLADVCAAGRDAERPYVGRRAPGNHGGDCTAGGPHSANARVFIQLYEVNETRRCNFFLNYNFFFGDSVSKSSFLLSPATVPLVLKDEGPVTSSVPLWLL